MTIFSSHGTFKYKQKQNYILTAIEGPFNSEGVIDFTSQLMALSIRQHCKAHLLIELSGLCLFTPDAEQELIEKLKSLHANGIEVLFVKFADSSTEFRNTMYRQIRRILKNSKVPSFISPP